MKNCTFISGIERVKDLEGLVVGTKVIDNCFCDDPQWFQAPKGSTSFLMTFNRDGEVGFDDRDIFSTRMKLEGVDSPSCSFLHSICLLDGAHDEIVDENPLGRP